MSENLWCHVWFMAHQIGLPCMFNAPQYAMKYLISPRKARQSCPGLVTIRSSLGTTLLREEKLDVSDSQRLEVLVTLERAVGQMSMVGQRNSQRLE